MEWLKSVVRALAEVLVQVAIDVALRPENVVRYKAALRAVASEDMVNAPVKGVADEEMVEKIEESGMAAVPLPEHPDA
jgi:hypothetical protein